MWQPPNVRGSALCPLVYETNLIWSFRDGAIGVREWAPAGSVGVWFMNYPKSYTPDVPRRIVDE